jgi:uracil phosphoribosyltransferase
MTATMPRDRAYDKLPKATGELDHAYGENVHILPDPLSLTLLGTLCKQETVQPEINELVRELYRPLLHRVINDVFPCEQTQIPTRMLEFTPQGVWSGQTVNRNTRAVTVNILRAGALPSQVCFDQLNRVLDPNLVRQDHVVMARTVDGAGKVTGAHFGDSKIGGDIDGAVVLLPDPMAATGGSMATAIDHYKTQVPGTPLCFVAMHLIVTPEYLKTMRDRHPEIGIYALRLDRGMSAPEILESKPGQHWEQETGLTDKQYIVPGGGGFGELINNAYCD